MACEQVYIFSYEQNYVNNIIQSEIINEVLEIGTRDADFPEVRELGPGMVASGRLIGLGRAPSHTHKNVGICHKNELDVIG